MNKKGVGGLEFLRAFLIAFTIIAVLCFALVLVGVNLKDSQTKDSATVLNESGYINSTGYQLSTYTIEGFANPVLIAVYNGTYPGNTVIELGNASVSAAGVVTNASIVMYRNASISYTYDYYSTGQNVMVDFIAGIASISDSFATWVALVGLVVIIGIISVVIYLVSRFGGNSEM